MKWYIAKLIYQIITGGGNHLPKFDEQFRLIRADEFEWAKEKATILGRLGECTFANDRQEMVTWKFIHVVDMYPITNMVDGVEIYSSTEEPKDVQEYLQTMTAKAHRLMISC